MLRRLREQGLSIIVSTPYMDEATLCDRIALIRKGIFMETDTPSSIVAHFNNPLFSVYGDNMPSLLRDIRKFEEVYSCFAFGDVHHVVMRSDGAKIEQLSEYLNNNGHTDVVIKEIKAVIEDCYMFLDKDDTR